MANKEKQHIYKLVLTGGPCSGKTTAMNQLTTFLTKHNYKVFTTPEAATTLFLNGCSINDFGVPNAAYTFQIGVLTTQVHLEDFFAKYAANFDQPAVILCDRGLMDGGAYMPRQEFDQLISENGLSTMACREGRYEAVLHLVTAADGAEKYYSLENNVTRTETVEGAKHVDALSQKIWSGHSEHHIFANNCTFEQKMRNLLCRVARLLRIDDAEYPMARTVTYDLLETPDASVYPDNTQVFQHDQTEITMPTGECLVLLNRWVGDDHAYISRSKCGVTVISRDEYDALKARHKHHITCNLHETRYSFVHEKNAMEVIVSTEGTASVQVHQNGHTVTFPLFLKMLAKMRYKL